MMGHLSMILDMVIIFMPPIQVYTPSICTMDHMFTEAELFLFRNFISSAQCIRITSGVCFIKALPIYQCLRTTDVYT